MYIYDTWHAFASKTSICYESESRPVFHRVGRAVTLARKGAALLKTCRSKVFETTVWNYGQRIEPGRANRLKSFLMGLMDFAAKTVDERTDTCVKDYCQSDFKIA